MAGKVLYRTSVVSSVTTCRCKFSVPESSAAHLKPNALNLRICERFPYCYRPKNVAFHRNALLTTFACPLLILQCIAPAGKYEPIYWIRINAVFFKSKIGKQSAQSLNKVPVISSKCCRQLANKMSIRVVDLIIPVGFLSRGEPRR